MVSLLEDILEKFRNANSELLDYLTKNRAGIMIFPTREDSLTNTLLESINQYSFSFHPSTNIDASSFFNSFYGFVSKQTSNLFNGYKISYGEIEALNEIISESLLSEDSVYKTLADPLIKNYLIESEKILEIPLFIEQNIKNFLDGMYEGVDFISRFKPDVIIFPIRGALPLEDVLRIIDNSAIGSHKVEYLYSSSSIFEVDDVIYYSALNLFNELSHLLIEKYLLDKKLKILVIDEVKSGHSLFRLSNRIRLSFQKKIEDFKSNETLKNVFKDVKISDLIDYKCLAIVDESYIKEGKQYQKGYEKMIEHGWVYPIKINKNFFMDRDEYIAIKLKRRDRNTYYAKMEKFEITKEYIDVLEYVSLKIGRNFDRELLEKAEKILSSERLIPSRYKG